MPRPFKLEGLRLAGKAMYDSDHVPGTMFGGAFCAAILEVAVMLFEATRGIDGETDVGASSGIEFGGTGN